MLSQSEIDLGNDTIIDVSDSLVLKIPGSFRSVEWSDQSNDNTKTIYASSLGKGIHLVTVSALDSLNCLRNDTLILGIADLASLRGQKDPGKINVYPNPSRGRVKVATSEKTILIEVLDMNAKSHISRIVNAQSFNIDLTTLERGTYILRIQTAMHIYTQKLVLIGG